MSFQKLSRFWMVRFLFFFVTSASFFAQVQDLSPSSFLQSDSVSSTLSLTAGDLVFQAREKLCLPGFGLLEESQKPRDCFMESRNTKEIQEGIDLYIQAADLGFVPAMSFLSSVFESGEMIAKNLDYARFWRLKAAQGGDIHARMDLVQSADSSVDQTTARLWLLEASSSGMIAARLHLAYLFKQEGDFEQAIYWWTQAALQGEGMAMFELGQIYEKGEGALKDLQKAKEWYEKAWQTGFVEAALSLSRILKPEDEFYKEFLEIGCENGDVVSMFSLGAYLLTTQGNDTLQGVIWLERAAHLGSNEAAYRLGEIFEEGILVEQDIVNAATWFQEAALRYHVPSMKKAAWYQERGIGLDWDPVQAYEWYYQSGDRQLMDYHEKAMNNRLNTALKVLRTKKFYITIEVTPTWTYIYSKDGTIRTNTKNQRFFALGAEEGQTKVLRFFRQGYEEQQLEVEFLSENRYKVDLKKQ